MANAFNGNPNPNPNPSHNPPILAQPLTQPLALTLTLTRPRGHEPRLVQDARRHGAPVDARDPPRLCRPHGQPDRRGQVRGDPLEERQDPPGRDAGGGAQRGAQPLRQLRHRRRRQVLPPLHQGLDAALGHPRGEARRVQRELRADEPRALQRRHGAHRAHQPHHRQPARQRHARRRRRLGQAEPDEARLLHRRPRGLPDQAHLELLDGRLQGGPAPRLHEGGRQGGADHLPLHRPADLQGDDARLHQRHPLER